MDILVTTKYDNGYKLDSILSFPIDAMPDDEGSYQVFNIDEKSLNASLGIISLKVEEELDYDAFPQVRLDYSRKYRNVFRYKDGEWEEADNYGSPVIEEGFFHTYGGYEIHGRLIVDRYDSYEFPYWLKLSIRKSDGRKDGLIDYEDAEYITDLPIIEYTIRCADTYEAETEEAGLPNNWGAKGFGMHDGCYLRSIYYQLDDYLATNKQLWNRIIKEYEERKNNADLQPKV